MRRFGLSALLVILTAAPVSAARERVGPCILEAGPGAERALVALARDARAIMPRLEEDLGVMFAAPFRMTLIAPDGRRPDDPAILRLDTGAPAWAAGYVVPASRTGAIRLGLAAQYPYGSPASVLAHEATHMLLHDASSEDLPVWFQEGVATLEGRRWSLEDFVIHATAVLTEDSPTLAELDDYFGASEPLAREAYAASFSFVSWTVHRHGERVLRDLLAETRRRPFADAWAAATGASLATEEAAWRAQVTTRYRWAGVLTASASLWLGVSVLAFVAGWVRRLRQRRARERWPDDEPPEAGLGAPEDTPPPGQATT